jgi:hypothetical protein
VTLSTFSQKALNNHQFLWENFFHKTQTQFFLFSRLPLDPKDHSPQFQPQPTPTSSDPED